LFFVQISFVFVQKIKKRRDVFRERCNQPTKNNETKWKLSSEAMEKASEGSSFLCMLSVENTRCTSCCRTTFRRENRFFQKKTKNYLVYKINYFIFVKQKE